MEKFRGLCAVLLLVFLLCFAGSEEPATYQSCEKSCNDSPYMLQDLESCECYCEANVECPSYKIWNEAACNCECRLTPSDCIKPNAWSNVTCQCLCPDTRRCRGNQTAAAPNCKCDCPDRDGKDQCIKSDVFNLWNQTSCECLFNPFVSMVGRLIGDKFSFTDLIKSMLGADDDDDYDEE